MPGSTFKKSRSRCCSAPGCDLAWNKRRHGEGDVDTPNCRHHMCRAPIDKYGICPTPKDPSDKILFCEKHGRCQGCSRPVPNWVTPEMLPWNGCSCHNPRTTHMTPQPPQPRPANVPIPHNNNYYQIQKQWQRPEVETAGAPAMAAAAEGGGGGGGGGGTPADVRIPPEVAQDRISRPIIIDQSNHHTRAARTTRQPIVNDTRNQPDMNPVEDDAEFKEDRQRRQQKQQQEEEEEEEEQEQKQQQQQQQQSYAAYSLAAVIANAAAVVASQRANDRHTMTEVAQDRARLLSDLEGLRRDVDRLKKELEGTKKELDETRTELEGARRERDEIRRTWDDAERNINDLIAFKVQEREEERNAIAEQCKRDQEDAVRREEEYEREIEARAEERMQARLAAESQEREKKRQVEAKFEQEVQDRMRRLQMGGQGVSQRDSQDVSQGGGSGGGGGGGGSHSSSGSGGGGGGGDKRYPRDRYRNVQGKRHPGLDIDETVLEEREDWGREEPLYGRTGGHGYGHGQEETENRYLDDDREARSSESNRRRPDDHHHAGLGLGDSFWGGMFNRVNRR